MKLRHASLAAAVTVATVFSLAACSSDNTTQNGTGGAASGGAASGGAASGGKPASGGQTASGGQGSGGLPGSGGLTGSGGQSSGGNSSSGGSANSGGSSNSGGNSSGGSSSGGSSNSGGQTSSGGGSSLPATFDTLKDVILEKCGGQGCHNDPQNALQMKFTDANLYSIITTHKVTKCSNMLVVSPGKPQESAILKVFTGTCGMIPRMPLTCMDDSDASCVQPDAIAAITKWIMNGAPEK